MGPRNLVRGIALPHLLTVVGGHRRRRDHGRAPVDPLPDRAGPPAGSGHRDAAAPGIRLRRRAARRRGRRRGHHGLVGARHPGQPPPRWRWTRPHGGRGVTSRSAGASRGRRQPGPGAAGSRRLGPGPPGPPGRRRRRARRGRRGHAGGRHRRRPRQPGPVGGQLGRRHRRRRRRRTWTSLQDDPRVEDLAAARRAPSQVGGKDAPVYSVESAQGGHGLQRARGTSPRGSRTRRSSAPGRPRCSGWASATRSPSARPTCRPASSASAS